MSAQQGPFAVLHSSSRQAIASSILAQFRLAAIALVISTVLMQWGLAHLNHERQAITRTEVIERGLRQLGEHLVDAEAAQRAYLLTGKEIDLAPFGQGTARITMVEQGLHAQMTDAAAQRSLAELDAVIQATLEELGKTIRLTQAGQRAAALDRVGSGADRRLMDRFRVVRDGTLDIEQHLLDQRRAFVSQAINLVVISSLASAALSIFLLFLAARRSAARLGAPVRVLLEKIEGFAGVMASRQGNASSADEISRLDQAFERMVAALDVAHTGREQALGDALASHANARSAEGRYQQLYEHTPAMLHSIDRQGRILTVSDHWLAVLGFTRDEVIGAPVIDFMTPVSAAYAVEQVLPKFFQQGRCDDIAYQFVRNDGVIIDVLLSAVLQYDAAGLGERSITVVTDVTERERLKRALQAQAALIEDLYNHAPCGYHSVDEEGRFLHINETAQQWLGYGAQELIGLRSPIDFCRGADAERWQVAFLRARNTLEGQTVEVVLAGRDQAPRSVNIAISVITDDQGAFLMTRSVMFDISQLKRTEDALRALHQEQDAIIENDLIGILRIRARHFVWVNAGFEQMLGYARGELRGLPTRVVYADEEHDHRSAGEDVQEALQRGESYRGEMLLAGKQGQRVWVAVHGRMFDAADGESLWTTMDITARKTVEQALHATRDFLAQTGSVAGVGGWSLDLPSCEVVWSDETYRLHEVPLETTITLEGAIGFYTVDAQPLIETAVRECAASGKPFDLELKMVSASGRPFWARAVGARQWQQGSAVRLIGALQDITARRKTAQALADSHELLRVTLDSIGDAVITTDTAGKIEWLNPVAERLTGWLKTEAHGRDLLQVFQIIHEETRQPAIDPVATCLAQGRIVGLANHTVLISRDGREYAIEDSASPIRDDQHDVLGAVLVFHDVSEQRRHGHEMRHRVTHDDLTDLVNRAEFESRLGRALTSVHEGMSIHVLMFIDLDQFKLVNDACGHAVGDQLLRQVGAMLQRNVRSHDTVARLGGDEFGLLLENCDAAHAEAVGKKICDHMDEFRFIHDGRRFRIGTSIGLVELDARWDTVDALMTAADTACYAAKEAGRNRVHAWFDTDLQTRARQHQVDWASRLEQAIDEDQFILFGQRIEGLQKPEQGLHCEILLRLPGPDGEMIAPGLFLPAAERFHLMPRIDRWVVRQVIRLLNPSTPHPRIVESIAINLSGQSIGDRSFHRDLLSLLRDAQFDLRTLCFEITETAAITNLSNARAFFLEVRALGVRIALDDFGAGASSFGYLKNLPVDVIKIDGQFITGLLLNPLDSVAVRCFRDVAQVVGLQTVAEFVGRVDIRDRLTEMGIDFAQGHLIHSPERFIDLLRQTRTA